MKDLGIIKTRCNLRGTYQPIRITTLECPKCKFYVEATPNTFCKRCGKQVSVPKGFEEHMEDISYIEYCKWVLDKLDTFYIYEIENAYHYSILLVTSREDLEDFISKSPFSNRSYKIKQRKVRDLKLFLQKCDGRIVITKSEWESLI